MVTETKLAVAESYSDALTWVDSATRPEFMQTRFVALMLETEGLSFFHGVTKFEELCAKRGISVRTLSACRAEVRRILSGAFKRRLAGTDIRKASGSMLLREREDESLPVPAICKHTSDTFCDEN